MQLWYDTPASQWVEALPVGNGRLGGMVFGGISEERIALNFRLSFLIVIRVRQKVLSSTLLIRARSLSSAAGD